MPMKILKNCFQEPQKTVFLDQNLVFQIPSKNGPEGVQTEPPKPSTTPDPAKTAKLEAGIDGDPQLRHEAEKKKELAESGKEAVRDKNADARRAFILEAGLPGKTPNKPSQAANTPPPSTGVDIGKKDPAQKPPEKPKEVKIDPEEKIKKAREKHPEKSPSGVDLMEKMKNLPYAERQKLILQQYKEGNITVKFIPVTVELKDEKGKPVLDSQGKVITARYYATGPVFLGKDKPVLYPSAGVTASLSASAIGCVLPTSKVALDMEEKGKFVPYIGYERIADENHVPKVDEIRYDINPITGKKAPNGRLMRNTEMYEAQNRLIENEMAKRGLKPGDNFFGATKIITAHPDLEDKDKQAIFGGRPGLGPSGLKRGDIIQSGKGGTGGHESTYDDYVNIPVHFVAEKMEIFMDGKKYIVSTSDVMKCGKQEKTPNGKQVKTVLERTDLWRLLSKDGPMDQSRMYKNRRLFPDDPVEAKVEVDIPAVVAEEGNPQANKDKVAINETSPPSAQVDNTKTDEPKKSDVPPTTATTEPASTPKQDKPPVAISAETVSTPPAIPNYPSIKFPQDQSDTKGSFASAAAKAKSEETDSGDAQPYPEKPSSIKTTPEAPTASLASDEAKISIQSLSKNAPQKPYTALGDSYTAGITSVLKQNSDAAKNFEKFGYHQDMTGKSTKWMEAKMKAEIVPKLAHKDASLSVFGGINDVLVDLKDENDLERVYKQTTENLESMYTLAHQNGIKTVGVTLPPLGQYMRTHNYSEPEKELHINLWERINKYIVSHEGKENGPDKVVRLDLLMADQNDPQIMAEEFGVDNDKAMHLHTNEYGRTFMAVQIENAIHELEQTTMK